MLKLNKKAFTLIEVIIIIAVLAIVAVTAFYTYSQTTKTFGFLNEYQKTISVIRKARSYALTNKKIGDQLPARYGVKIYGTVNADDEKIIKVALLADTTELATETFIYDPYEYAFKFCKIPGDDCDKSITIQYRMPVTIWYERGTGNVSVMAKNPNNSTISPIAEDFAVLFSRGTPVFGENDENKKYIVIFKVSGLAEEYKYPLPW